MNTQSTSNPQLEAALQHKALRGIGSIMWPRYQDHMQDVLQNAHVKAIRKASDFRGESSYSTWFCRVAINEALMFLRGKEVKHQVSLETEQFSDMLEALRYDGPDPEERFLARERLVQLKRAICRLSPRMRQAILYWARKDRDDMALSQGQKALVHRAIRILREEMQEFCNG